VSLGLQQGQSVTSFADGGGLRPQSTSVSMSGGVHYQLSKTRWSCWRVACGVLQPRLLQPRLRPAGHLARQSEELPPVIQVWGGGVHCWGLGGARGLARWRGRMRTALRLSHVSQPYVMEGGGKWQ